MDHAKFFVNSLAGSWPFAALLVASFVILPLSFFW